MHLSLYTHRYDIMCIRHQNIILVLLLIFSHLIWESNSVKINKGSGYVKFMYIHTIQHNLTCIFRVMCTSIYKAKKAIYLFQCDNSDLQQYKCLCFYHNHHHSANVPLPLSTLQDLFHIISPSNLLGDFSIFV